MAEWTITDPTALDLDEAVTAIDVRLIAGHVDVVTSDGPARLEVTEVDGAPVRVRHEGGRLSIAHEELHWEGVLGWLRLPRERRRAVVSVAVPADARASVAVVSADAVLSGLSGGVKVRCVSGDVVLDETSGDVHVESVSGDVEGRGVSGEVTLKTVSGSLTVVDGAPAKVRARSISGDVVLDVRHAAQLAIDVTTVSGDVTVRLPDDAGLRVDVLSTSGDVASGFEGLDLQSRPGSRKLSGHVGDGHGELHGRTVSGNVALLVREAATPRGGAE